MHKPCKNKTCKTSVQRAAIHSIHTRCNRLAQMREFNCHCFLFCTQHRENRLQTHNNGHREQRVEIFLFGTHPISSSACSTNSNNSQGFNPLESGQPHKPFINSLSEEGEGDSSNSASRGIKIVQFELRREEHSHCQKEREREIGGKTRWGHDLKITETPTHVTVFYASEQANTKGKIATKKAHCAKVSRCGGKITFTHDSHVHNPRRRK